MTLDFVVNAGAIVLGIIFVVSGLSKLRDLAGTQRAIREFGIPGPYAGKLGPLLPAVELLAAGVILLPRTQLAGAIIALGLLLIFSTAIAINLWLQRTPECRCFGQLDSGPISYWTLARNGGLMTLAASVAAYRLLDPTAFTDPPAIAALLAGTLGGLLAFVAFGFNPLRHPAKQPSAPVASGPDESIALVSASHGDRLAEGNSSSIRASNGVIAPPFELPDTAGEMVSLESLLQGGRTALLLFIDPDCDVCESMLPEILAWESAHASHITVQIISVGTEAENRPKQQRFGIPRILIQEDWEVADAYGSESVPDAVLVLPDGRVDGRIASGPEEIRQLLERISQSSSLRRPLSSSIAERGAPSFGSQTQSET